MTIPLLQTISKSYIYNESLYDERHLFASLFTFLLFFVFRSRKIREKDIVLSITIIGLVIFIIQVWQQLYPNYAVFGVYTSDTWERGKDIAEERDNMYRFRLGTTFITLFCFYYYWDILQRKYSFLNLCMFIFFSISIYLYLTRQILFASILTISFSFIFVKSKSKNKWRMILAILFVNILLFSYYSSLFGALIEKTVEESDESNIRVIASVFFWNKIIENPIMFMIGHGHINDMINWQIIYDIYHTDVGIIGEWFLYGCLWVALYIYTLFLVLYKYSDAIPLYIKLFVFGTSINSIMIFPYRTMYEYYIWVMMLYITSLYVDKKRQARLMGQL